MKRRTFVAGMAATGSSLAVPTLAFAQSETSATPASGGASTAKIDVQTGYAPINGLQQYYEIHGKGGVRLVLLHGAYMFTGAMEPLLSELAKTRQVIATDFQGHGRTADIDRPITFEQLADDAAALMDYLGMEQADVAGYSMGASTGLQLAIRHPEKVRKLVAASGQYRLDGMYPEVIAPDPQQFPQLVEKLKVLDATDFAWPEKDLQSIPAPVLLIYGDSDVIKPEHAIALFRLLGGGVPGDLTGLPKSQLAILPGTTHITVMNRTPWLVEMINEFLAAPLTEATPVATG